MNADHVDAMILLARVHAKFEATEATMTSVDRLGFFLRLKTAEEMRALASTSFARLLPRRKPVRYLWRWYNRPVRVADLVQMADRLGALQR
jgi:hypothetical protein